MCDHNSPHERLRRARVFQIVQTVPLQQKQEQKGKLASGAVRASVPHTRVQGIPGATEAPRLQRAVAPILASRATPILESNTSISGCYL